MKPTVKTARIVTATCSCIFALNALITVNASAADSNPPPSEVVKFDELNIKAATGMAALYARIHGAARRVCPTGAAETLSQRQAQRESIANAEAHAAGPSTGARMRRDLCRDAGGGLPAN